MKTLLTYLELEEVLMATGSFCNEYIFQPQRPIEAITGMPRRASGPHSFTGCSVWRAWVTPGGRSMWRELCRHLRVPRDRILEALTALEVQGELVLQSAAG